MLTVEGYIQESLNYIQEIQEISIIRDRNFVQSHLLDNHKIFVNI